MLGDGSPAELWELEGEALWKKPQGPKNVSLEKCDLGLGAGKVPGAYARLPRYFKDTDKVQDLESRLLTCMTDLQGRSLKDATARLFGNADRPSEMEYLVAYIGSLTPGVPMAAEAPSERGVRAGQALPPRRAPGFSCASCHGEAKRIRCRTAGAVKPRSHAGSATWPAYRVSTSQFKTIQWRMNTATGRCAPKPAAGSVTNHHLIHFITVTGKGEAYRGPGNKR
jgi:sulfur-oxidizing protein SoxA